MKLARVISLFTAGLVTLAPIHEAVADHLVRCESRNDRYSYCRTDVRGRVRLNRRLSDARCDYGRTWGYDRRGVWVTRGCRAVFEVGGFGFNQNYDPRYDPYSYDDRDDRDDHDDGLSDGQVAALALGALVGGAVIGSLATNSANTPAPQPTPYRPPTYQSPPSYPSNPSIPSDDSFATGGAIGSARPDDFRYENEYERGRVPSWLVGRFRGKSTIYKKELDLSVYSDGTAVIGAGQNRDQGKYRDGRIEIGGRSYTVLQNGSGLKLIEIGDARNELRFTKVY